MMLGDPAGGPSLGGMVGSVAGFTVGYLVAEAAVSGPMHPIHWMIAFVAGLLAYFAGHAIWLYREGYLDIPWRHGSSDELPVQHPRQRDRR